LRGAAKLIIVTSMSSKRLLPRLSLSALLGGLLLRPARR